MKKSRYAPDVRRDEIMRAAVTLAGRDGYLNVTRNSIAQFIGVSGPAVQYHIGTMAKFRRDLMRHAVATRNARVVAQGLANNDKHALKADEELKREARAAL